VATSPITWRIDEDVAGAPVTLDDTVPETTLYIDVTSAGIPDRAWGSIDVTNVVAQSVVTADEALTLDFVRRTRARYECGPGRRVRERGPSEGRWGLG
jgi:hypothetical protein